MCYRCTFPRSDRAIRNLREATCDRCGHYGTCWLIEEPDPPTWRRVLICYGCLAQAALEAA